MNFVQIPNLPAATALSGMEQLEAVQAGVSVRTTVAQIATFAQHRRLGNVSYYLEDYLAVYGPNPTPGQVALAFLAAARAVGSVGGPVPLYLPPGVLIMGANPDNEVGPNDGAGLYMTEEMSGIFFIGGPTEIRPVTNTVQLFAIVGASGTAFTRIYFNNRANGVLQGQDKPLVQIPGGGVAGLGNAANMAIGQYAGADVTVYDCKFAQMHTSIRYAGDYLNDDVVVGSLIVDQAQYDGCVFGVLALQPRTLSHTNWEYINGVNSINVPDDDDPGHGTYLANRLGAFPQTVVIANFRGYNNMSSTAKIRKAEAAAIGNYAIGASQRGIEAWNCLALTIANGSVNLTNVVGVIDMNSSALELTDCGDYEISTLYINTSGSNAWGLRIRGEAPNEPWQHVNGRIRGVTIQGDLSQSSGKSWILCTGQTDVELHEPIARVTGNVAQGKPVVEVDTGTRVRIKRPQRRAVAAGTPAGSDRLVSFTDNCVGCIVEYARDDLDTAPTANTVVKNASVGTKVFRVDGEQSGTWTPTLAFETAPGLGDITVTASDCLWFNRGPNWRLVVNVTFTTNAYTGSGVLQLSGTLDNGGGVLAGAIADVKAAIGNHQMIDTTATDIGAAMNTGNNFITFRRNVVPSSAGSTLTDANFPPGTADFVLGFEISYTAAE